ncbi:MAG TPA: hypothetical protein VGK22_07115 [Candidatus Angelobacter sp.]|jgi:hypothetical protein
MKIQRQITSILSTMLIASMSLGLPLQAQQSTQQPSTAQQQPQSQPTQPATTPTNSQPAPSTDQSIAPATGNQQSTSQPANGQQPANQQSPTPGTNVNPSQGPLTPVTTYPDASGEQQAQPQTAPAQNIPEGPQPKKPSEPVGAATAESVPTTGGAAAKPAGVAIAPAKQHQTRSLLLKVGAVVAAGAALGTVYALSHGTASTPPGSNLPGVTQK